MLETQGESESLLFKSCKINFIYSFLLDIQSRNSYLGGSEGSPLTRLHKILNKPPESKLESKKPPERIGVTTNLTIEGANKTLFWKCSCENLSIVAKKTPTPQQAFEKVVTLEKVMRINDNGASMLTLTINMDNSDRDITAVDVHNVYNLIPINSEKDALFTLRDSDGNEKSLFQYFIRIIDNEILSHFSPIANQPFLLDIMVLEDNNEQIKDWQIKDWQNPFVITELELNKDVFIGYHGRGGIIVSCLKSRDSAIVKELTESYLDLMETLRARWHLCVMFGEIISKDLDDLISRESDALFKFTEKLLSRRELFIRFLADPTMYAFEGGVVSEICKKARQDLYIDTLTETVSEKFSALEKYYRGCIDLAFEELMKK